jgi:hypothetical protein
MPTIGELVLEMRCANCGRSRVVMPDNASDDSELRCGICQIALGPYGLIKQELLSDISTGSNAVRQREISFRPLNDADVVDVRPVTWREDGAAEVHVLTPRGGPHVRRAARRPQKVGRGDRQRDCHEQRVGTCFDKPSSRRYRASPSHRS